MDNPIAIYVPVCEVFPEVISDHKTFLKLLSNLSRTDVLFWCARLNSVISNEAVDQVDGQQIIIRYFLEPDEIGLTNSFIEQNGGSQRVRVFFRGQLLELIKWASFCCYDHCDDGTTFRDPNIRKQFIQVALIASDIWAERVFEKRKSPNLFLDKNRTLGSIRKSMEGSCKVPSFERSLGRGWIIFSEYFPVIYPSIMQEFYTLTKLSLEQYYWSLASILTNFMNADFQNTGIFNINALGVAPEYQDILRKHIVIESQSPDDLMRALHLLSRDTSNPNFNSSYDYKPLRIKPIIRTKDGRAIIMDPVFYSQKASVGPLFHVIQNAKSNGKVNEIFSAFGKSFENYSCDILRRMFPTVAFLTERLQCNVPVVDKDRNVLEIDACLNDVSEVVLFEMKAAWIREDMILCENHENYLDELRRKYGVSEGAVNERKIKGVGQLARIIGVLSDEKLLPSNPDFGKAKIIYPVLVVHDDLLAAPTYGAFLASEFQTSLQPCEILPSGNLKKNGLVINPLIVMDIDDLEDLEKSVEYISFKEIISDYSTSCSDRKVSLHNYLSSSKYRDYIYHNKYLAQTCFELLSKTKEKIFQS